jgi:hypothetical protein
MRAPLAALVAAATLAAAGCGGSDERTSEPSRYRPAAPDGFESFRDCLADEGIELPQPDDPPGSPGARPELTEKQRQALAKCQAELPVAPDNLQQ